MRDELYTYYDLSQSNELKHVNKLKVLAYKITTANMVQHFLRIIDSMLVDPRKFNMWEIMKGREEFVKVSEEIYDKYHKILNDESRATIRSLERLI